MSSYLNISFYKFVDISPEELPGLRQKLLDKCISENIVGTILLATEGINACIAGPRSGLEAFKTFLEQDSRFTELPYKESLSERQPFKRTLVKIKKEIIAFGIEGIRPRKHTAPRLEPKELKTWYDEGKKFVILDTRNDYEIRTGTFKNAVDMSLKTFRQFPIEAQKLPQEMKNLPVVTFCTGGIRCEKAAALLEHYGFEEVYQLNGGILRYFEECGAAHYNGECFVFDRRVGVDGDLQETSTVICHRCQMPVLEEEQKLPSYVLGKSCLHCVDGKVFHKEKIAESIALSSAHRHGDSTSPS